MGFSKRLLNFLLIFHFLEEIFLISLIQKIEIFSGIVNSECISPNSYVRTEFENV
jgi:hypothetical protein